MRNTIRFILQSVTVGLAAAIVLLFLLPGSGWRSPVVELQQAPAPIPGGTLTAGSGPVSYADSVGRAAPAVVNVHTAKLVAERISPLMRDPILRRFFGRGSAQPRQRVETSLGSGVIISPQGYLLTNNHVIEDADEIAVMLQDGRSARAALVGTDPDTDLAVLRIKMDDLPSVTIGQSESLRVGDVVLAIGDPFGVGQTVTMGIVSATGRSDLGINTFEDFIQTDAAINPGNSGGALVDAHGNLVGINTAIYSQSGGSLGIGFAIPVALAKQVLGEIIEHGRVVRGWLGIEVQAVSQELAESFDLEDTGGVLVAGVQRNGPAHQAGLEPGDIILRIGEQPVAGGRDALERITRVAPGTELELTIWRNGRTGTTRAEVAERPPTKRSDRS